MFYFAFYKLVTAIVGHLFTDFPNYFEKLYSFLYMIITSAFWFVFRLFWQEISQVWVDEKKNKQKTSKQNKNNSNKNCLRLCICFSARAFSYHLACLALSLGFSLR